ncbi:MAG: glycosyltransferase family 4 protein [Flavobacteriales bacterium]|nr:glycosyltransferase family 4 protein [Flavobacteriales bacterium]
MLEDKKALIIGKVWPEPKSSAAGIRMMQLIDFYLKEGLNIIFATTAKRTGFEESLDNLKLEVKEIQLNSNSFNEFVSEYSPNLVVFDRFMTEEQFGWRVTQSCPDAKQILNTEDLHFLRDARREASKKEASLDITNLRTDLLFRELMAIQRCDLTLLVSKVEYDLLKDSYEVPEDKLHYLPLFRKQNKDCLPYEARKDFMFIGNYYHEPNWDALLMLKKEVWPRIRKRLPKAKLNIYGAYSNQKVLDLQNEKEGFIIHGRVDETDSVFSQARICLAPIRFGAGIKGKFLEAMANGTPVVTTTVGAEDMLIENEWCGILSDNFNEMADSAVDLYNNQEQWDASQRIGFNILKTKFQVGPYREDFARIIDKLDVERKKSLTEELIQHHSLKSSMYLSKWISEKENKK